MRFGLMAVVVALMFCSAAQAQDAAPASDAPVFVLTLKDHAFAPQELTIPANTRIKLVIKNQDPTSAEFESDDFQAEKIVPANGEVSLFIAPLKSGSYGFYDDFHEDDTKGKLIVP
jgi:hypothetical protein